MADFQPAQGWLSSELWVTERQTDNLALSLRVTETLFHGVSPYQTVDVVTTAQFGRMLLLDGKVMTTEWDEFVYHEMLSHIPLLAHPEPKSVLVIGGGDGGIVREALRHPQVQEITLCEIDGMVIDACKQYLPTIAGELSNPRVHVIVGDGIAHVAENLGAYDVVLVDSTDPFGPAEGLIAESFYRDVAKALKPGGIMAAQTESPIAYSEPFQVIYQRLPKVFAHVAPYVAAIPTYPGGFWSWCLCSNQPLDTTSLVVERANRLNALQTQTRYLNTDTFAAVFALPNYVRRLLPEALASGNRSTAVC